jgi:hypothetical protein
MLAPGEFVSQGINHRHRFRAVLEQLLYSGNAASAPQLLHSVDFPGAVRCNAPTHPKQLGGPLQVFVDGLPGTVSALIKATLKDIAPPRHAQSPLVQLLGKSHPAALACFLFPDGQAPVWALLHLLSPQLKHISDAQPGSHADLHS